MKKDFDEWNEIKKETDDSSPRLYTVREIWWCRFGLNIGTEQNGGDQFSRPCIILRGFGPDACLIAPLTTSRKEHHHRIPIGTVSGRSAKANLSQIKTIDTRRLIRKVGFLEKDIFEILRKNARTLF
ncbi:MAG: mRNA interferase MazF [Patescibacteria group bacterium]|jgi:mRNA-degrading endonuclease toxin of MazEF toxin-antitoxin module|nr:mRNA interferase MazF [Patescibacteria group bacterium]